MLKNSKYMVLITAIVFLCAGTVYGQKFTAELNANADDVEAKFDVQFPAYDALANVGIGVVVSQDNYTVGDLHFVIKDEVFTPALSLGLGFKGAIGEVEIHKIDYDLSAIGFVLMGEYDFRQIYAKVPICVYADIAASPSPLSFGDTKSFVTTNLGIRAYIVRQAAAVVGYRYVKAKFEENSGDKKASFDAIFLGLQVTF